jgi:hypothetical protein
MRHLSGVRKIAVSVCETFSEFLHYLYVSRPRSTERIPCPRHTLRMFPEAMTLQAVQ